MAAWLLTISKDYPQHWKFAKEHGLWDLITPRGIKAGDVVYYWQSGASLLGKVRVLQDAYEIDADQVTPGPWDDWPGSDEKPYVQRFPLEVLAGEAAEQPRWHDVAAATGLSKNPTFVRTLKPEQQAVLDEYLGGDPNPQQSLSDAQREHIFATMDEDLRSAESRWWRSGRDSRSSAEHSWVRTGDGVRSPGPRSRQYWRPHTSGHTRATTPTRSGTVCSCAPTCMPSSTSSS
ncbi:hypothetical protein [Ornithinimicrobium avium]|uniref:hypothetical protein n=1 Tax=Ornithinimicrobium avium TaxID=2283195 RepID=UPI001D1955F1|nr:hypothetical protein [Ornithinimicrobium avium]